MEMKQTSRYHYVFTENIREFECGEILDFSSLRGLFVESRK